jgi:hypothetical protein
VEDLKLRRSRALRQPQDSVESIMEAVVSLVQQEDGSDGSSDSSEGSSSASNVEHGLFFFKITQIKKREK